DAVHLHDEARRARGPADDDLRDLVTQRLAARPGLRRRVVQAELRAGVRDDLVVAERLDPEAGALLARRRERARLRAVLRRERRLRARGAVEPVAVRLRVGRRTEIE